MLINISNHLSNEWDTEQLNEAIKLYKEVVDYPFPHISPNLELEDLIAIAKNVVNDIINKYNNTDITIHVMGEHNFVYNLVKEFEKLKIQCVASTTERIVTKHNNNIIRNFKFVKFRNYF